MKKIVILHVFDDEKFFDGVSKFFDALDNVHNRYCFYTSRKNYQFKHIKLSHKVEIFNNYKEYTNLFSDEDIDIIYFQSLYINKYKLFNYISDEKKVIWWCFGAEIYYSYKGLKPLINIELYKPLTKKYKKSKDNGIIYSLKDFFKSIIFTHYKALQNKVISRIDYFSPVLPIEYELMKNNPHFRAKPFMLNAGPGIYTPKPLSIKQIPQNILIGNSLTYTNNHLDIFQHLKTTNIASTRKYIIPINYGSDYTKDKRFLKDSFCSSSQTIWLEEFIPRSEYLSYLESITHAIFGHIRQQAMGNINYCLERGIKIYLYSDSIAYKQLKELGYIIYNIETDLTQDSLNEVLDEKSARINYNIFCSTIKDRVNKAIQEIINITYL